MGRLKGLVLEEFSIVRGDDVQPANPQAVDFLYKSTKKTKEQVQMDKTTQTPAAGTKPTLKAQLLAAVNAVLKGQQTRTSNYSSTSTETITDDSAPGAADNDGATVIIVDSAPASTDTPAPAVNKTEPAPANDPIPGITDVLKTSLAPLVASVSQLDSRLAKLEKAPVGSQAINKYSQGGVMVTDNAQSKFPDFTKFLAQNANLSPGQKLSKATLTSSGWSYGLSFVEGGNFIDYIVDQSTILKQCRTIKMPNVKMVIDKIGLGGKVLVKGVPGTDPGDTVSLSGPTQVELTAVEILAIVSIGDDTLEDNIEGDAFVQHLLGMIGRSAANEIEQGAMLGDTAVADTGILDRWDGWYKLAKANGAHVIEGMADADRYWPGGTPVGSKMTRLLKALPTKYRQDLAMLRLLLHNDVMLDYLDALATTVTPDAFRAITGMAGVPIRGVQQVQVPLMSTAMGFTYSATPYTDGTFTMLTDVRNLIVGIHREIKIEPYRQPRKRCTDYILSMRGDVKIENGDAIAIYDHAKVH